MAAMIKYHKQETHTTGIYFLLLWRLEIWNQDVGRVGSSEVNEREDSIHAMLLASDRFLAIVGWTLTL
jgi:hypothetical protein